MSTDAFDEPLEGLLFIGDPHLSSRVPGFRLDDYPRVALEKLRWCLEHAREARLLPVLLGDLFHWPRDNANWLLSELMALLPSGLATVAGNHDCHENSLGEDDSLTILTRAGRLRLLDGAGRWRGQIGGCQVVLGGTSWGQPLPDEVVHPSAGATAAQGPPRWTFWVTHHDIGFPGYVAADPSLKPRPIAGVDVVVNGHIHAARPDVVCGATTWLNPGNITRLSRDALDLSRSPAALAIRVTEEAWTPQRVIIPHERARDVFAPVEVDEAPGVWANGSEFVQGLGDLLARRTESGAGLRRFLNENLSDFEPEVAAEILELAREVLPDDTILPEPSTGDGDAASALRSAQQAENPD